MSDTETEYYAMTNLTDPYEVAHAILSLQRDIGYIDLLKAMTMPPHIANFTVLDVLEEMATEDWKQSATHEVKPDEADGIYEIHKANVAEWSARAAILAEAYKTMDVSKSVWF